ncbi:MAG: hemolysin family protein [Beijerinckiaceae bacterium]
MTEHDPLGEAGKTGSGAKPSLLERLRALFGLGGASIRDDIEDALADTSIEEDISPQERALLKNVLALHEVQVGDVMVPRADIVATPLQTKLADVLEVFRTAGHSRLPVHGETLDDPRGMVHIRDFVAYLGAAPIPSHRTESAAGPPPAELGDEEGASCRLPRRGLDLPLSQANILRPVLFVPASMPALDLLVKMQATRTHMALVIDEYGGTEGLASIEDIVEMIVGDIEDEHDSGESPKIEAAADGNFVVDARADLGEVFRAIDADPDLIGDTGEVDTLGGLVTALAGHVPARGEIIIADGIEFEVVDADPRRVKRVKIRIPGARPPPRQIADNPAPSGLAKQGGPPEKGGR